VSFAGFEASIINAAKKARHVDFAATAASKTAPTALRKACAVTIETIVSTVVSAMVSDARVLELCLKYGDEEMAARLRQRAYYGSRPNMSTEEEAQGELSPAHMAVASETILLLDPDSPRTTPRNSFSGEAGLLLLAQHAEQYGPAAADAAASALDAGGYSASSTGAEQTSPPVGVSPLQASSSPSDSAGLGDRDRPGLGAPPDAGSLRSPRSPQSPLLVPKAAPSPAAPAPEVACPSFTADELEALKVPCAFADFGPGHERALAYMRWRCSAAPPTHTLPTYTARRLL